MAKLVAPAFLLRQLSGSNPQTSLKNTKWATYAKEWPTHSSLPKKYPKKYHKLSLKKLKLKITLNVKLMRSVVTVPCLTLVFALVSCAQLPDTEGPRVRQSCHRVHSEKSGKTKILIK